MARKPYGRKEPIISNVMWRNLLVQSAYQLTVLLTLYFRGCEIWGMQDAEPIYELFPPPSPPGPPPLPAGAARAPGGMPPPPPPLAALMPGGITISPTPRPVATAANGFVAGYNTQRGCPPERWPASKGGHRLNSVERLTFHDWNTITCFIFNAFVWCQVFNEVNVRSMERVNVFSGLLSNRIFVGVLLATAVVQFIIVEFAGDFAQTIHLSWRYWIASLIIGFVSMPIAALAKLIPVPEEPNLATVIVPGFLRGRTVVENECAADLELEKGTGGDRVVQA